MSNYGNIVRLSEIKYGLLEFYKKYKYLILTILFFLILSVLTGCFTAVKIYKNNKDINYCDFSFITLYNGTIYNFVVFTRRYLSALVVIAILTLAAINKHLKILGFMFICYRAFLLSLNCVFIILLLGLGGALNAILIILPCNILCILIMSIYFILCINLGNNKNNCKKNGGLGKYLVITMVGVLLINGLECLLLFILKPTTILII